MEANYKQDTEKVRIWTEVEEREKKQTIFFGVVLDIGTERIRKYLFDERINE